MEYSDHFNNMIKERNIDISWVDITISKPEKKETDDFGNTHFIKKIPDFGNRYLRVIINENVYPPKGITAFFDRRIRKQKWD